jgi:hypothetical protein
MSAKGCLVCGMSTSTFIGVFTKVGTGASLGMRGITRCQG